MIFRAMSFGDGNGGKPLVVPFLISLVGHALVFGLVLYTPKSEPGRLGFPSVISVQMVELSGGAATPVGTIDSGDDPAVAVSDAPRPVEPRSPAAPQPQPRESAPAEISLAPQPPRAKSALKYQTMRTREEPRPTPSPTPRPEQRAAPSPPVNPLEETIRRLREQVEREGRPGGGAGGTGTGQETTGGGRAGFGFGGGQEVEAIDLYRLEVAFTVQKNWAFADQLAGARGDRVASLVFKVMPDGRIEDIFFTDRSGNPHLDESAYRAIVKSSPVRPHPSDIRLPYVEMGLRFTPKGVQ